MSMTPEEEEEFMRVDYVDRWYRQAKFTANITLILLWILLGVVTWQNRAHMPSPLFGLMLTATLFLPPALCHFAIKAAYSLGRSWDWEWRNKHLPP